MNEVFVRKGVHDESVAAMALLTEVPAETIVGYFAVAVLENDSYIVATNSCCMQHSTAVLGQAITIISKGHMCSSDAVT